ncbi:hypothetical protein YERSI8AC_250052 [Enterobacterales bacterium 8AC]|nr:hypothetical protein YERSI8AC_250052 [Enterobacterales bacterium 8AC]
MVITVVAENDGMDISNKVSTVSRRVILFFDWF